MANNENDCDVEFDQKMSPKELRECNNYQCSNNSLQSISINKKRLNKNVKKGTEEDFLIIGLRKIKEFKEQLLSIAK